MADPRKTRTHAADSAPGVGDGPAGAPAPSVNSKPGGRKAAWLIVGLAVLVVIVALMTRMGGGDADEGMVALETSPSEVQTTPPPAPPPEGTRSAQGANAPPP